MGIFDWWRSSKQQLDAETVSEDLIRQATDYVVKLVNPRLVVVRRYRERLADPVQGTIVWLRAGVQSLLPERDANAAAWAADPTIRAFFARPDDLVRAFSRSNELHDFFDSAPDAVEAHAVLGMAMREQQSLGMKLQGEVIQRDVPQTTLSFSDYKVRIVAATEPGVHRELGRRIFEQLCMQALDRIGGVKDRRNDLEQHRALLKARQRLLQQGSAGMKAVVGDEPVPRDEQLRKIEAQLEENERELAALGPGALALESELEMLCETLVGSGDSVVFGVRRVRLDSMNIVVEGESAEQSREIEFNVLDIKGTPPLRRAGALVRFPRVELLSRETLLQDAQRFLG